MPGPNITLNKNTPNYPNKVPPDVADAPQVVVKWDPSFPSTGSLQFQLQVTDSLGIQSNIASVSVNIQAKPVANLVGPNANNAVSVGTDIALDGSKSTGTGLTYKWTLVS